MRLQAVEAVEVDQSPVGQLLGYGTVVVGPAHGAAHRAPEPGLPARRTAASELVLEVPRKPTRSRFSRSSDPGKDPVGVVLRDARRRTCVCLVVALGQGRRARRLDDSRRLSCMSRLARSGSSRRWPAASERREAAGRLALKSLCEPPASEPKAPARMAARTRLMLRERGLENLQRPQ